jgi:hypothetical protein
MSRKRAEIKNMAEPATTVIRARIAVVAIGSSYIYPIKNITHEREREFHTPFRPLSEANVGN